MKRLAALFIVVTMTIGGATVLMAADLPQAPQAVLGAERTLPDAALAQVSGMGITNSGWEMLMLYCNFNINTDGGFIVPASVTLQLRSFGPGHVVDPPHPKHP